MKCHISAMHEPAIGAYLSNSSQRAMVCSAMKSGTKSEPMPSTAHDPKATSDGRKTLACHLPKTDYHSLFGADNAALAQGGYGHATS